ncbi:MAG: SPOR domain-containing protein [Sinobacteraceae bacterium]|nr:SPOR domain-containing protein [Nevskiaceae bacterium]MCP5471921.1 SPOR domain-containing protein [Nevskiaceae bacterium]
MQIDMDAQLKYRLTGAVILVLLAVLFVPELLTGPKHATPDAGPVSATTVHDGPPLRSYDIDLSDARSVVPMADAGMASPPPAMSPDRSEPPAPPVEAPAAAARAVAPPAGPPRPATTGRSDGSEAASKPAASATATPRATVPAAAAVPTRGFAVQVGSFASRASADRLAADLRRRQFQAFVEPVRSGGRQLYRVRVGPVEDREAAQALVVRLKAAGQAGSVVPLS